MPAVHDWGFICMRFIGRGRGASLPQTPFVGVEFVQRQGRRKSSRQAVTVETESGEYRSYEFRVPKTCVIPYQHVLSGGGFGVRGQGIEMKMPLSSPGPSSLHPHLRLAGQTNLRAFFRHPNEKIGARLVVIVGKAAFRTGPASQEGAGPNESAPHVRENAQYYCRVLSREGRDENDAKPSQQPIGVCVMRLSREMREREREKLFRAY